MRHYEVKVRRDTQTVYVLTVPEWEIPILEFIYEDANVERLEKIEVVDRPYPSERYEFDRLARAYGKDPQTGESFVSKVYGNAGIGERALKRLMLDERNAEAAEPAKAKVKRQARAAARAPSADDPLLD